MPLIGRQAFLGLATEVTRGTAVSPRTHFFRAISLGLSAQDMKRGTPALAQASASFMRRAHYVERHEAGGAFRVQFGYEGHGPLITAIMGASASTSGPSGGIYTHTWALGTALKSYTLHAGRGTGVGGSTAQGETFEGCQFSRAVLGVEQGGVMYFEADVLAELGGGPTTLDTAAYPSELYVLHHQGGSLTFDGNTYKVRNLRLTIDRHLERVYVLGSENTELCVPTDHTEVMVEADVYATNEALLTAQTADTQGDLAASFTGSGSRSLGITLQNAYLDSVSSSVDAVGQRFHACRWRGESDGTDEGLSVVIANTQSAAEAA